MSGFGETDQNYRFLGQDDHILPKKIQKKGEKIFWPKLSPLENYSKRP